jgi:hypothetical protein
VSNTYNFDITNPGSKHFPTRVEKILALVLHNFQGRGKRIPGKGRKILGECVLKRRWKGRDGGGRSMLRHVLLIKLLALCPAML